MAANSNELKPTGKIIQTRRTELGLTRAQLGEKIGKSENSIKKYETGNIDIPFSVLKEICVALDLEIIFLRGTRDIVVRNKR
ncbi:MAG: helix-turn-helix domain-containing protein [Oscillospiraceae bacterium]